MTQEHYDRIAYDCLNGDTSKFEKLSEAEKDYFRKHFAEEWEDEHYVCYEARRGGAR